VKRRLLLIVVALVALVCCVGAYFKWCAMRAEGRRMSAREAMYRDMGIFAPGSEEFVALPPETPHRAGAAVLGSMLFADKRLVKSSKRMCAACHPPSAGGADNKVHGRFLTRSSQNAAFALCYLHDGSLRSLKDVVEYMISSPDYGAYSTTGAVARLLRDQALASRFVANYETGLVGSNVVDSIVQHLRARITSTGAFDRYLSGKTDAFDAVQERGFAVFKTSSCASCHDGPTLGGRKVSEGRKVPALRGLAKRRLFLTDGSAADVSTALFRMPTAELSDEDRSALVAFLKSL